MVRLQVLSSFLLWKKHHIKTGRKAGRPGALEAGPVRRQAGDDRQGGAGGVVADGRPERLHPDAGAGRDAGHVRWQGGDQSGGRLLGGVRERPEPGGGGPRDRIRPQQEASVHWGWLWWYVAVAVKLGFSGGIRIGI